MTTNRLDSVLQMYLDSARYDRRKPSWVWKHLQWEFRDWTIEELEHVASTLGYKKGWAKHQFLEQQEAIAERIARDKQWQADAPERERQAEERKAKQAAERRARNEAFKKEFAEAWKNPIPDPYKGWERARREWHEKRSFVPQGEHLIILGLTMPFTESVLRAAYRQKSKLLHPDVGGSHEEFIKLTEAYETLLTAIATEVHP